MTEPRRPPAESPGWFSARKIIVNLLGFGVGLLLFAWIVRSAVQGGDWSRLADAAPGLVVALLGCTVVSTAANATTFWVSIRPIKPLRMVDLQLLNLAANVLNYAPLRLGVIARVAYHLRVDRLTLLQVGAWFAFIGYVLVLGIGSCLLATLARDRLDWIWIAMVAGQMVLGAAALRVVVGYRMVARFTRGLEVFATNRASLWGTVGLRVVDLLAYTGRMGAAAAILQMTFPATHIVVLAVVALAASLIPFGRFGFREACVALAAARLGMENGEVTSAWAQLALVESAGEVLVFVPLGGLSLLWYRKRWLGAGGVAAGRPAAEAS